jgi:hypothetical protein
MVGAIATACINVASEFEGDMLVAEPDSLTAWPVLVLDKMAELHKPVFPAPDV